MGDEQSKDELKLEKTRASVAQDMGCYITIVAAAVCVASVSIMATAYNSSSPWWGAVAVVGLAAMGAVAAYALMARK